MQEHKITKQVIKIIKDLDKLASQIQAGVRATQQIIKEIKELNEKPKEENES